MSVPDTTTYWLSVGYALACGDRPLELSVNGEVKVNGAGSAVFGDPVRFPGRFQCVFCVSFRVISHHVSCLTSSAPISLDLLHFSAFGLSHLTRIMLRVGCMQVNSLMFLAEELGKFGHTLKAGDFIITGATCILPPTDYVEGDIVTATFVGLGEVTLNTGGAARL